MKKSLWLVAAFLCYYSTSFSQEKNPLVDSREVITNALKKYKDGKYKEAVEIYKQVPESDTNYSMLLNGLILAYYSDSNYVMSQKLAEVGLKRFPSKAPEWNNLLANSLDDAGKKEEALVVYDKIIKSCPYNYVAWYDKGVTYYRLKRFKDATVCFTKALLINPYYSLAHYYLGKVEMEQGNLVNAMMAFMGNMLVYPSNANHLRSVQNLNSISEVNKDIVEFTKKYKPSAINDFDAIQEIITSKVALDKGYKLKIKLEDVITRQVQVLMEKVEFNANDKGFFMQFYAPLLQKVYKDGLFEPFVFYMFSDLNIEKVQDYNKHNKKDLDKMKTVVVDYFNQIRESQTLEFNQRSTVKERFIINDSKVVGKGTIETDNKGKARLVGYSEFYHNNGAFKAKGKYDNDGERTGLWEFYYDDGTLKEKTNYASGKAQGVTESWYDNGVVQIKSNYVDDKENGVYTSWFYNGLKKEDENYANGNITGNFAYYNKYGILNSSGKYTDQKIDGSLKKYFENGALSSVTNYEKGIANGAFKSYTN
jgi:antitoxin component YwqK of YwqJK toxin-antitoxin module